MSGETRPHYWLGERLDDAQLESRLASLDALAGAAPLETETLVSACDRLAARLADTSSALLKRLKEVVDGPDAEVEAAFDELSGLLRRASVEAKLARELGSTRPFLLTRVSYAEDVFEAWAPLGLLVHVSPQNSFATGAMSVIEGLLAGNVNLLKTGGAEPPFAQRFLEALAQEDPTGALKGRIAVARIPSARKDLLARVFAAADGIAVWGGEDTTLAVRALAPRHARVVEWGHRISFIYLTVEAAGDERALEAVALECCRQEQQACSSPQCVYVDTADWDALNGVAEGLARAMGRVSPTVPRAEPDDAAAAEISMVTLCQELESCHGRARVLRAADGAWRILVDAREALVPSPLYRSVWLKPLPRAKIVETLRPMRAYQQTAGLACGLSDAAELTASLLAAGAVRVRALGAMSGSYAGEPHDGTYALARYCRRVSVQLPAARGISTFDELTAYPPARHAAGTPVTPKEAFSGEDPAARLFFRSGGSSGEPKISAFTWAQYDDDVRYGAEGLFAAGLDPERDRCMNLFFAGGLYGGFVSIFSALERLGAVQFPMAAHADLELVARTIVERRVDTLLGMPSYLINLFERNAAPLERYRGVRKIFFGGEHFTAAQRDYLRGRFGVESIRSAAYGSVDIGPMGFQCERCEDGVHHLQQKLHALEILKLDEDAPVAGEEAGRLVFSPRAPGSAKPARYAVGDVGHWLAETSCPCGRRSPRFKLLGRTGDVFRIGSCFFSYRKLAEILSTHGRYAGDVQVLLLEVDRRETLRLRIARGLGLSAAECARLCRQRYEELEEAVGKDGTLRFDVEEARPEDFDRSPASGKLLSVVDRRRR